VTPHQVQALQQLADALARDVGRLRYTVKDDRFHVDRLARHAWTLAGFVQPTAADLYNETGDVERALADVDEHARRFGRLLGEVER
jgi:hypothetical protein